MLTAALAAIALNQTATPTASSFYPLVPGVAWTYVTTPGGTETTDTVGEPIRLNGKDAYPVRTTFKGQSMGATYYRIEGDTVYTLGFDRSGGQGIIELRPQHPVLKLGAPKASWTYVGFSPFVKENDPFQFKASSQLLGKRDVLGTEREILEVVMDAQIGETGVGAKVKQTTLYARGVGMIEMTEDSIVGKEKHHRVVKLVKFTVPQ